MFLLKESNCLGLAVVSSYRNTIRPNFNKLPYKTNVGKKSNTVRRCATDLISHKC